MLHDPPFRTARGEHLAARPARASISLVVPPDFLETSLKNSSKHKAFADGLESVIIEAVASHLFTRFFTFQIAGIAIAAGASPNEQSPRPGIQ
jgi:hypothetical protein